MYRGMPRSIYVLFFARIVNSIGSFVFPFLTMFLTDKLGLSAGEAGIYILLSGLSFIPGSFLGGKLADVIALTRKIAPSLNVMLAGVLYAVGFGMIYFLKTPLLFYVSTFIWTVGEIISVTNSDVYIANHTPVSHRGRFNSILPVIINSGFIVSPALMGGFIERFEVNSVWIFAFILSVVGVTALIILYSVERRVKRRVKESAGST